MKSKLKLLLLSMTALSCATIANAANFAALRPANSDGNFITPSGTYDGLTGGTPFYASSATITVTVGDGTGTIVLGEDGTPITANFIMDADNNANTAKLGHLIYNGNLEAYMTRTGSQATPIQANYDGSSVTVNGDLKLQLTYTRSSGSSGYAYGLHATEGGIININGDFDISGSALATASGITNSFVGVIASSFYEDGQSAVQLGKTAADSIFIHDIYAQGTDEAEAAGIYAYGWNDNCQIDAYGKVEISGLVSNGPIANTLGVVAFLDSQINFHSDLVIKNLTATGTDAWVWSLYAEDGGIINVNPTASAGNTIQIDDDIFVSGSGSTVNLNLANNASYFKGVVVEDNGGLVNLNLSNGGTWFVPETTRISGIVSNGGVVDLRNATQYTTLTVGNWTANNTDLYLNTYFDGDGNSTDMLAVDGGDATGDTTVFLTSRGKNDAETTGNGILIVDLTNAADKTATFALPGDAFDTGALKYVLTRESDDNWYLQSVAPSNTGDTVKNMPAVNLTMVKTGMNELRKRLGDLRNSHADDNAGIWVRGYGKHLKVDDSISEKMSIFGMESGVDVKVPTPIGDVYIGIMGGYLYSGNVKINQSNSFDGKGHANVPSLGAYVTWLNGDGWFVDATTRYFWTKMDMRNISAAGQPINYDIDRNFITGTLETGKQFGFNVSKAQSAQVVVEPKAEIQYAYAGSNDTHTSFGNDIRYDKTDSLTTRLAVQASYLSDGKQSTFKPFVEVGIYYEWLGKTDIEFAGVNMKSDVSGFGTEISAGLDAALTHSISLYGDVSYEFGAVYQAISGNVGVRYTF